MIFLRRLLKKVFVNKFLMGQQLSPNPMSCGYALLVEKKITFLVGFTFINDRTILIAAKFILYLRRRKSLTKADNQIFPMKQTI